MTSGNLNNIALQLQNSHSFTIFPLLIDIVHCICGQPAITSSPIHSFRVVNQFAAGPAFGTLHPFRFRLQLSPHLPSVFCHFYSSKKKSNKMPKKQQVQERIPLGRPGNNLKSGIVCERGPHPFFPFFFPHSTVHYSNFAGKNLLKPPFPPFHPRFFSLFFPLLHSDNAVILRLVLPTSASRRSSSPSPSPPLVTRPISPMPPLSPRRPVSSFPMSGMTGSATTTSLSLGFLPI